MATVYALEPPTSGKVTLRTTHGDLDIELWCKECPKACRNFIQLCLEGYYDHLIFHRLIKNFIIQSGDHTGTGNGGASIYGESYPNEFHSRLKFRYRGLVGVANAGRDSRTNASQFFITLNKAEALNEQSTLFGKVTGDTIYNLVAMGEMETDSRDCPLVPPMILSTHVLVNPFTDLIPRDIEHPHQKARRERLEREALDLEASRAAQAAAALPEKKLTAAVQKKGLLSFQNEDDDEEEGAPLLPRRIVAAHDLVSDLPSNLTPLEEPHSKPVPLAALGEHTAMWGAKRRRREDQANEDQEAASKRVKTVEAPKRDSTHGFTTGVRRKKKEEGDDTLDKLARFQARLKEKKASAPRPTVDSEAEEGEEGWLTTKLEFAVDSSKA